MVKPDGDWPFKTNAVLEVEDRLVESGGQCGAARLGTGFLMRKGVAGESLERTWEKTQSHAFGVAGQWTMGRERKPVPVG